MPEPAENYSSNEVRELFRAQAWRVWTIALAITLVWIALIVAPPLLITNGFEYLATQIYTFFSYICHQKPERSFHVLGYQFAVCSRCFGVYLGLLAGVATYPLWRRVDDVEPLPRFWLFLSLIPIGIDWVLGAFGIWENTYASRFITGLILGVACAVFVVPALVEIVRNIKSRGGRKKNSATDKHGCTQISYRIRVHPWRNKAVWRGHASASEQSLTKIRRSIRIEANDYLWHLQKKAVAAAKSDLAKRLKIGERDISGGSVSESDFPDMALGAAGKGEMAGQMISSGWTIKLNAGGKNYEYRADKYQLRLKDFEGKNHKVG